MYLVYVDDSTEDSSFQIIGAVIVKDVIFKPLEEFLARVIDESVPEELRPDFEFHASALFHAKKPFEAISRDKALDIFESCVSIITEGRVPICYGAVDLRKLRASVYATAQPVDMAFRSCLAGIEKWFEKTYEDAVPFKALKDQPDDHFGILISDDTKNTHVKEGMQKAFRAHRRRLKSVSHTRGLLEHLHDDMYFGSSSYSVGIQLADICSFVILRHLQGKEDTEYLFKKLQSHIIYSDVIPKLEAALAEGALDAQPSNL